jgi:hypothetical protein
MTFDLALDITADGTNGIKLTMTDPTGRKVLPRALPALDQGQLDDLRRGESLEATAAPLADAISGWLLGTDLTKRLTKVLGGQDALRVVVRMDRTLVATLSDLPVELVSLPQSLLPLVLHPKVHSLVHVPPIVGATTVTEEHDWPFRVLIVRSNPIDLGGAVPEVTPIVKDILDVAASAGLPEGAVQIELLSSEEAGADFATWPRFRKLLGSGTFDVFVYLGHGDLQVALAGTAPVGYLQFESADGKGHQSIAARDIAAELAQHPVRVVVLAGCLTAAGPPKDAEEAELQALVTKNLPLWLRGAQGVAQAIIDSDAPVELAVGMRDLLEVNTATVMLGSFFRNLIKDHPGDVERAIREARSDLFGGGRYPPSWSSAVVFVKGTAPVFQFLAEKPAQAAFLAEKQKQFDLVRQFRQSTERQFLDAVGDRTPILGFLAFTGEQDKAVLKKDAMVRPRFVQSPAGPVQIPMELVNAIKTKRLTGKVSISGENAAIDELVPDPRLEVAGFALLSSKDGAKARFSIENDGPGASKLSAGPLFTIRATIGSTAPAVHEVVVTRAANDPETIVWSGMDVIAVVP